MTHLFVHGDPLYAFSWDVKLRETFHQKSQATLTPSNHGVNRARCRTCSEETRTFWFNPASFEASGEFQLVGIVLGLAIYNSVILDVHLPRVLYKKLLGQKPSFEDLKNTFPELGRGLQQLLEFEGDVEGVFCRTFEVGRGSLSACLSPNLFWLYFFLSHALIAFCNARGRYVVMCPLS